LRIKTAAISAVFAFAAGKRRVGTLPPSDEGGGFCRRQKPEGETLHSFSLPQSAAQTAPSSEGALIRAGKYYEVKSMWRRAGALAQQRPEGKMSETINLSVCPAGSHLP